MSNANDNEQVKAMKPSEIIGIVAATMLKQSETAHVVYVEGIYQQRNNNRGWAACYDGLRDPNGAEEITLKMSWDMRKELTQGNLVIVGGLLNRNVNEKGQIQLMLNVTRVMEQQTVGLSDAEAERISLLKDKLKRGYKNVDNILERILFKDERPRVALVVATTSVTMSDFESAINAAKASIDFTEMRTNLANCTELCATLAAVDLDGYDAVAIVRGGGLGIEKLDEMEVLRAVSAMKTPTISAVGHAEERLTFKEIVDKEVATPTALGQFFSELSERVAEEKTQSKAVLVEQVRKQMTKQYEERIAGLEKQLSENKKLSADERTALLDQLKKGVEDRAAINEKLKTNKQSIENMQQRINQLNDKESRQKRLIIGLVIGLVAAVGFIIWIAIR